MSYDPSDTIAAIATAPGGAARGMVRVSGPAALATAAACFEADNGQAIGELRHATVVRGRVRVTLDGTAPRPLPCELFVWPTERSYTRQPVVELHTIASPPLLTAVLQAVCRAGARLAEPGEFTLRAFLAGRLDLTQAEAVLGVIDARGTSELDAALAQLAGGLAGPLHALRDDLLQLLAELEAGLDFVEDDIRFITPEQLVARLQSASELLQEVAEQMTARLAGTDAAQVVLVGLPNVGKSSLFNALVDHCGSVDADGTASRSPALVSGRPGTTRDYLSATIRLDGVRCELIDTAGIELPDEVGEIGAAAQRLSGERRARAVLRIWCAEAGSSLPTLPKDAELIVLTKADIAAPSGIVVPMANAPVLVTSSRTGDGLDELAGELRRLLTQGTTSEAGQVVAATADRCRESVHRAGAALQRATEAAAADSGEELLAVEVRDVLHELGKVVGAVYTDDLLDRIFKTFCIGK